MSDFSFLVRRLHCGAALFAIELLVESRVMFVTALDKMERILNNAIKRPVDLLTQ